MKILFFALHCGYYRNFDSVLRELADRGHAITLSADQESDFGSRAVAEALAADYDRVDFRWTPQPRGGFWRVFVRELRHAIAYAHFLGPWFDESPTAREACRERTPKVLAWLLERVRAYLGTSGLLAAGRILRFAERALPTESTLVSLIKELEPDQVWITPLLGVSEWQFDELRAAQAAGVRVLFCVNSWDNLSTMAPIRPEPDHVLVWNEIQQREAVDRHGVAPGKVTVSGAQSFDRWYELVPAMSREAFCERIGLDPSRPLVLYVCSAVLRGGPNEAAVVRRWIRAVRASDDPRLRTANILVRPHPQRIDFWDGVDLSTTEGVVVWGDNPVDTRSREDYFESLYYCDAVVGVSSTAMVEAALLGKPVHTVLLPEYRRDQEGLIHFHYLLEAAAGPLHAAREFDEHVRLLGQSLRRSQPDPRSLRFAETFVRPHGRSEAAGPRFMAAVERLGAGPAPSARGSTPAELIARWLVVYPIMSLTWIGWVTPSALHWISTRPRELSRWITRSVRRARQTLVRLEKALMPSGYVRVRSFRQLAPFRLQRLRLLVVWSFTGRLPEPHEALLGSTVGGDLPPAVVRWLLLYPIFGVAWTAGGAWNLWIRASARATRTMARVRDRLRKGDWGPAPRIRAWRSDVKMAWHRRKKRIRSLYRNALARLGRS